MLRKKSATTSTQLNYPTQLFSIVHDQMYGKICMMRAVIFVFLLQRIGLQTYSPSVDLSHACFLTPALTYSQKLMRPSRMSLHESILHKNDL